MARAVSINDLLTKKRNVLAFDSEWHDLVGCPEMSGSWIIWGGSTSGKTSFALQLAKYLARFDRVAYNSLEEGDCQSMKLAFERAGMIEVAKRVILLDREPMNELVERLEKHKSPNIIIIDSLQYTQITLAQYIEVKSKFPNKLFIFISHADGKEPDGKVARRIRYDSNVKIYVSGYKAYCNSRYGGGIPYVIWAEGAAQCWGVSNQSNTNQNLLPDETVS